jgi:hypothetical protein
MDKYFFVKFVCDTPASEGLAMYLYYFPQLVKLLLFLKSDLLLWDVQMFTRIFN